MDKIFIHNLHVEGILGVHPYEQNTPRPILISTVITTDITQAAEDDDILKTISYSTLSKDISKFVKATHYFTIEALIEALAKDILKKDRVEEVWLRIEKPGAVADAEAVGIEITRHKGH